MISNSQNKLNAGSDVVLGHGAPGMSHGGESPEDELFDLLTSHRSDS